MTEHAEKGGEASECSKKIPCQKWSEADVAVKLTAFEATAPNGHPLAAPVTSSPEINLEISGDCALAISEAPTRPAQPAILLRDVIAPVKPCHLLHPAFFEGSGERSLG